MRYYKIWAAVLRLTPPAQSISPMGFMGDAVTMMMSSSVWMDPEPLRRRGDQELARYAKLEYRDSNTGWLLAQLKRESRAGRRPRVRSWIARHLTRKIQQKGALLKESLAHP